MKSANSDQTKSRPETKEHYPIRIGVSTLLVICVMYSLLTASLYGDVTERLSIDGYFKNFSVVYNLPATDLPELGAVSNRLRLNLAFEPSDRVSVLLAYGPAIRIQDHLLFGVSLQPVGLDRFRYRVDDLDERLYPSEGDPVGSFAIMQNLDRASLAVRGSGFDFYVGRQPIAWGTARVINPTDVIAPFIYSELDTEDRAGVDAVRLRVPLGFMGEIDGGYVFGEDLKFERSAFFVRGKFYLAHTDLSLAAIGFRENLLLGFDLARALGGAGFWFETGYVFVDAFNNDRGYSNEDYLRLSVGLDYSFSSSLYGFIEYHYNQPGSSDSDDYLTNLAGSAYREGAVYLLGEHYLSPGMTWQITPLLTLNAEALVNMNDPSVLGAPGLEYNLAEDIYISAGAYLGLGRSPRVLCSSCALPVMHGLRSEFGGYADMFYTSFRFYF